MGLTANELWLVIHGTLLWTIFLLAFASGIIGLWNLRPEVVAIAGFEQRMRRLTRGVQVAAISAWLAVLTGTYILFPGFRARPPEGAELAKFPRAYLQSVADLAEWNDAMEWKQQLAWFAPILATAVAYVAVRYGRRLADEPKIRQALTVLFTVSFFAAVIAGSIGALITKVVPMH